MFFLLLLTAQQIMASDCGRFLRPTEISRADWSRVLTPWNTSNRWAERRPLPAGIIHNHERLTPLFDAYVHGTWVEVGETDAETVVGHVVGFHEDPSSGLWVRMRNPYEMYTLASNRLQHIERFNSYDAWNEALYRTETYAHQKLIIFDKLTQSYIRSQRIWWRTAHNSDTGTVMLIRARAQAGRTEVIFKLFGKSRKAWRQLHLDEIDEVSYSELPP